LSSFKNARKCGVGLTVAWISKTWVLLIAHPQSSMVLDSREKAVENFYLQLIVARLVD